MQALGADGDLQGGQDGRVGMLEVTNDSSEDSTQIQSEGKVHMSVQLNTQGVETDSNVRQDAGIEAGKKVPEIDLDQSKNIDQDARVDIG